MCMAYLSYLSSTVSPEEGGVLTYFLIFKINIFTHDWFSNFISDLCAHLCFLLRSISSSVLILVSSTACGIERFLHDRQEVGFDLRLTHEYRGGLNNFSVSRLRSVHQVLDNSDNDQVARFQGVQVFASSCPVRSSSFLLIALDCPPLSDEPWALSLIDTSSGHRKRHRTGNQSTHLAAHNHMLARHVSQVSQVSTGRSRSIFSVSGMSVARLGYNAGAWLDLERVWLFVSSDKIYTASHPALRQFH